MAANPPALKIKLQLMCGDEIAMGPGKADLLETIAREGSISGAGRAMGMSYRRAWLLVDAMNRCWREPLVHAAPGRGGGGSSGGARLTSMGEQVLSAYRALQATVATATAADWEALRGGMLAAPRPAKASARMEG